MARERWWSVLMSAVMICACCLPAFAASLYEKAEEAYFGGQIDEAIELYKRCINEESDRAPYAAVKLFAVYKRLHRYDDAAALIPTLIKLTGDKGYRTDLGDVYRTAGKHYEAQRLYQEVLSQNQNDDQALYGMGCSLEATSSFDAAREYYSRAANLNGPYSAAARRHLTRISEANNRDPIDLDVEIGRWPKNIRPIKVYVADGGSVSAYRSHMRQIMLDAITAWNNAGHGLFEMAVVNEPAGANILVNWVTSLNGALGVTVPLTTNEKSIKRAKISISIGMDSQGRPLPPETTATRQLYEARDRVLREVTLHELGHALGLDHSKRTDDIMADGIFGMNSADVPSARELQPGDIERIQELYKDNGTNSSIATSRGAYESAQSDDVDDDNNHATPATPRGAGFRTATAPSTATGASRSPEMAQAMFNITSGRYSESRDVLTTVLNRDPRNAMAHYLMAVTMVNLRDYKSAADHYHQVLKLVPNGELSKRATDGLAKIKL